MFPWRLDKIIKKNKVSNAFRKISLIVFFSNFYLIKFIKEKNQNSVML